MTRRTLSAGWRAAAALVGGPVDDLVAADLAYTLYNAQRALHPHAGPLQTRSVGQATAVRDLRRDDPYYNRVIGLTERDLPALDGAIDWLAAAGRTCHLTLTPDRATSPLLESLAYRGFSQVGSDAFFVIDAARVEPPTSPIEVRRAERGDLERVFDLWETTGSTRSTPAVRRARVDRHLVDRFPIFVARIEGALVAMGTVFVHRGVAWLGNANTDRAFRGRGCQMALTQHRLWHAHQRGCRWGVTDTQLGSVSHRNALRAGMSLGFTTQELALRPPG